MTASLSPNQKKNANPSLQTKFLSNPLYTHRRDDSNQSDYTLADISIRSPSTEPTPKSNHTSKIKSWPAYTPEQVASHNKSDDLWVIIEGSIYNLSKFVNYHPGGQLAIKGVAGTDCTDVFKVFHANNSINKQLLVFKCGELVDWKPSQLQIDFNRMKQQVEESGLLKTDLKFYWGKVVEQICLISICLFCLLTAHRLYSYHHNTTLSTIISPESPNNQYYDGIYAHIFFVSSAFWLGMFWQQIAFLGHDFGHNSVFGCLRKDFWGSMIVTLFFGVSAAWWKRSHNIHHIHTNSIESDPDIQHLPIFSVAKEITSKPFYSTYHQKYFMLDKFAKPLVSNQHYFYYLAMALARYNLYVQSILVIFDRSKTVYKRGWEIAAICGYWILYAFLIYTMPTWSIAWYYVIICHTVAGLTHIQITLSHFAMPVHSDFNVDKKDSDNFILNQFATTMNISCPTWMDWLHGGLQFQIEHHLLPRVPRHNLRYVSENYIKPFAQKHEIKYHALDFFSANKLIISTLKTAAISARKTNVFNLAQSVLAEAFMAEG